MNLEKVSQFYTGALSKSEQHFLDKIEIKIKYLKYVRDYVKHYYLDKLMNDEESRSYHCCLADETTQNKIIDQLLRTYKNIIFENSCPKCHRLPRTPLAQQCPYCLSQWELDKTKLVYSQYLKSDKDKLRQELNIKD